jgi:hypothetical protein
VGGAVDLRGAPYATVAVLTLAAASCAAFRPATICRFPIPPDVPLVATSVQPSDFLVAWSVDERQGRRRTLEVAASPVDGVRWRVRERTLRDADAVGTSRLSVEAAEAVWRALVEARIDSVDAGTPAPDYCGANASHVERFQVEADGAGRLVWRRADERDLDGVRAALLALLPPNVAAPFGR